MMERMYFIGLSILEIQPCRILKKKESSNPEFEADFILEFATPIPAEIYNRPKDISKVIFASHVLKGQKSIYGSIICPRREERMDRIDFDMPEFEWQEGSSMPILTYNNSVEDRAILCVSEEQAKEQLRFLEEAKNRRLRHISLERSEGADCRIIQWLTIDHRKNYWLAELIFPLSGKKYGQEKDISKVILRLNDFAESSHGFDVIVYSFDENSLRGDSVKSTDIKWIYLDQGFLTRKL
ncbi:hypothetical protein HY772_07505 [Candidatus Woesearchaeota archaeon]|nr:hypothetical protein [Candidatus Woesearchaeota archaeon]